MPAHDPTIEAGAGQTRYFFCCFQLRGRTGHCVLRFQGLSREFVRTGLMAAVRAQILERQVVGATSDLIIFSLSEILPDDPRGGRNRSDRRAAAHLLLLCNLVAAFVFGGACRAGVWPAAVAAGAGMCISYYFLALSLAHIPRYE